MPPPTTSARSFKLTARAGPLVLLGCLLAALAPANADAAELRGRVLSGDRPIAFAPVTLYRSLPDAPRPALVGRAWTGPRGAFGIAYRAPRRRDAVLYATVGRRAPSHRGQATAADDGPPPVDPAAVRLAAVLDARRIPRRIVINERTTVAAGFALAQFIDGPTVRGTAPGLPNAAGMAANLVDVRSGRPARVLRRPPNGRRTSTLRALNSLANMLARCARDERACARLFGLADPPRRPAPRGTLAAVADIARNPWQNVGRLFALGRSGPTPYAPALAGSARPDAWTLALRFEGDGTSMSGPGNFAIDADGNVWVLNNYQYSRDPRHSVCGSDLLLKFTPDGRYARGSPYSGGGLSGAGFGITFDPDGNLWVGNYGFAAVGCEQLPAHDSVSKFTSSGQPLSPPEGFTAGSISWPQGTVSDRAGNIWIANCGNDTVTLLPGGEPAAARNLAGLGLEKPFDVAVDDRGRAFVTGVGSSSVAVLNPDGSPADGSPISGGGLERPMGIAVDSRANMWVANSGLIDLPCPTATPSLATRGGSLTLIGRNGKPARASAFTGGGLTIPWGIAVDGDDNVWVANFGRQRVSQFCGLRPITCPPGKRTGDPISPDGSGYGFDGLVRNTGVAVDPSGNVWLTNNWKRIPIQTNPGGYQIVAFVGAAAPLRTPLIGPPRKR